MNSTVFTRRRFLREAGSALALSPALANVVPAFAMASATEGSALAESDQQMPAWEPGFLDIHHISTGRGNCAFLLCPDGTTIMIDAGSKVPQASPKTAKYLIDAKPNDSLRPGQWIARYVQRCMAQAHREEIDCFLLTHLHDDHMGEILPGDTSISPISKYGNYQLGGLMDVAEVLPVKKIIDRAYPDYNYPSPLDDPYQKNYRAFVRSFVSRGGSAERFKPGSATQVKLLHRPDQFSTFSIRNLAANGEVWTGVAEETRSIFPSLADLKPVDYPTENKCSLAIRLSYGKFDYFSSGDMDHEVHYGRLPWGDIESPVARVAGPVDVAVANHHGWRDACGPEWVSALRPRVFVIHAWHASHPTMAALDNMLSTELYPGERDVFSTAIKPESKIAVGRLGELKSDNGHVVIRVHPGGEQFEIFTISNEDETQRVIARHGPYSCT
ncbi:ComEC/Rec2 family competence protein [Granulicella arctica]|uniref:Beta-lactamase superfamily II metal-dependent hydrolase n=1 Tax=Granulicella arctica TaxID=940613 RepID=A0A7Y9PJ48_9BACT|nr:hypothetical protein [Granulicella arctica]NYF80858.1 beta-lactamase superfamily II metal-dependent hydrolase [Granulicella arctica]